MRESTVEATSPAINDRAKPWKIGSNRIMLAPTTTAAAVNSIGRNRTAPASTTASSSDIPCERRSSMKSTRMMELRTMIPAPAMKPIMEVAVKHVRAGCPPASAEISYAYHIHLGVELLTATVLMTNPHLYLGSGGNIGVCNIGAATISGVVLAGGYSPGIDTPYPGLDNIVNGLIQIGFEPAQSLAASAIGNGVGLLFSAIATPAGNMLC